MAIAGSTRDSVPLLAAALGLVLALSTSAAPARAQAPPPPAGDATREQQRADLFKEGLSLADAGRWAEAVDRFRQVIAIRSAPKALFTLGQAEEKLGKLAAAQRTYQRALADARTAGEHAVMDAAGEALRELDPRVPRLTLRLEGPAAREHATDARVTVDGQQALLGEVIALDPGDHDVLVEAPGAHPFSRRVQVVEARTVEVVATLEPLGPPPATEPQLVRAEPSAPPKESAPSVVGPLLLGGAGIAAVTVGLLVRSAARSDYDANASQCPGGNCPTAELRDAGNAARGRMALGEVVALVGGAALVGAGIFLVIVESASRRSSVGITATGNALGGAWRTAF